jgi:two-component system sensor histidine kinase AgrC
LEDVANIDLGEDKHYIDLKYKMLETIINNKLTICEKENIKVNAIDFSGINESLQGIDESDLCTIICNLMDNAVEACQKCKGEKSISLTVVKEINYIKIRVANNAETTNLAYNGKALKTSKKDKASHGIGTQIINDLAIMYDGETYYKLKDNKFTATVYLSCANDVCKS